MRPKIEVALGSGAARGWAEIDMLEGLAALGIVHLGDDIFHLRLMFSTNKSQASRRSPSRTEGPWAVKSM
jgi:hypothetical protein